MARSKYEDLLLLGVLSVLAGALVVAFPSWHSWIRVAIVSPALLFTPGFALSIALFPNTRALTTVERISLSLALSVVMIFVLGLALDLAGIKIRAQSISFGTCVVTVGTLALSAVLRSRAGSDTAFVLRLPRDMGRLFFKAGLSVCLVGLLLAIAHSGTRYAPYSDFYVLGDHAQLQGYPKYLYPGEPFSVVLGISNHERTSVRYMIQESGDATSTQAKEPLAEPLIAPGATWVRRFVFFAPVARGKHRLVFTLEEGAKVSPRRQVSLSITVVDKGTGTQNPSD